MFCQLIVARFGRRAGIFREVLKTLGFEITHLFLNEIFLNKTGSTFLNRAVKAAD